MDLGVLVDEKLSFKDHIQDKINKAFSMLGIIKRNFKHLDIYSFTLLYKSMVRSQLDYCSSDNDALEKVQKRATKVLPELKNKSYIERLKMCNLPTLHFRRIRGDMIEVFKILTGKYDTAAAPVMDICDLTTTRGNDFLS